MLLAEFYRPMLDGIIISDDKGKVIYSKQSPSSPLKVKGQSNVEWAAKIIKFSFNPNFQSPQEGAYRAINYNERLIVYNVVDRIFYIAVGDLELGELACNFNFLILVSDVVSKMYGSIFHVLKKSPDDVDTILKNYPKITLLLDDLMVDDGYSSFVLEETKISKKVIL